MKFKYVFNIILVLALVGSVVFYLQFKKTYQNIYPFTDNYEHTQKLKYSFNLKNIAARDLNTAKVWLSIPVAINASQYMHSINTTEKFKIFSDVNHNQQIFFDYKNIAKGTMKNVSIDISLAIAKTPNLTLADDSGDFLKSEKYVDITSPEIIALAADLKDSTVLNTTHNILTWLAEHKPISNNAQKEPATQDTSHFDFLTHVSDSKLSILYLYLSLSRSLNIPSRGVIGFDQNRGQVQTAKDTRVWAEFYDGKTWQLVDLDAAKLSSDRSSFIVFNILFEMPDSINATTYSLLHKESAFVLDENSVKIQFLKN